MRSLALVFLLANGCSGRGLVADVRSGDGQPLPGAVVSSVCEPRGSAAAESDASGTAVLAIHESTELERCIVTVAREHYRTQQFEVELCADLSVCDALSVALEPE